MKSSQFLRIFTFAARAIALILTSSLAILMINLLMMLITLWLFTLSKLWFVLVLIFLGSILWNATLMISTTLMMLVSRISPNKWFGLVVISILSILNGIRVCYYNWAANVDPSVWGYFALVAITILIIELTLAMILGAANAVDFSSEKAVVKVEINKLLEIEKPKMDIQSFDVSKQEFEAQQYHKAADELAYSPENRLEIGSELTYQGQPLSIADINEEEGIVWLMDANGQTMDFPIESVRDEIQKQIDLEEVLSLFKSEVLQTASAKAANN